MATITQTDLESFKATIRGEIILPDSSNFDEVRSIWNAMIDRKPTLIVQCTGVADVKACLAFAKSEKLEICIRGGGHNIAGNAIRDNGLMIDLSLLRSVSVDPVAKSVVVGPGATLGDIDHETKEYDLAVPTGVNSTTGITGLTLGGGMGWLTREHGLTVDNLISAEVVTASGEVLNVSEDENPDLFWAIRGGGGNYGIVTRWKFQLQPAGDVLAGLLVFPESEAKKVSQQYRDLVPTLPNHMSVWCVYRKAPPLPFLPEEVHGQNVYILALCHNGDVDEGNKFVDTMRGFGNPVGEHIGVMPFASWQQAFDPLLGEGARNYWKSHNFTELSDDLINTILEYAAALPSDECEIFIAQVEGVANHIAPDAMAYAHRHTKYVINMHGRWQNSEDDEFCIQWARDLFEDTKQYAAPGAYINFMTAEETDRIKDGFGCNYDRLVEIKTKYDPENIFNMNQNVKPG